MQVRNKSVPVFDKSRQFDVMNINGYLTLKQRMLFNLPNLNIICLVSSEILLEVCVVKIKKSTFVCFKGRNGEITTKY